MNAGGQTSVDVILPTYRGRSFVREAIESVLAQTHPTLHLTIVDDASPDGTLDFIREHYASQPERISLIGLETQRRAAGARMEALRRTRGEIIAFIDHDDRWQPEKLERQLARLAGRPEVQAVHTDVTHIDASGRTLPGAAEEENAARAALDWDALTGEALVRSCFLRNRIRLASALVRRDSFEAAGGFDEGLFGGEDWEFWVRFAAAGQRIAHLPQPLVERRMHAANTSATQAERRLEGQFAALDRVLARHPELAALGPARRAALLRTEVLRQLRDGRGAPARARLRELRALDPGSRERLALWLLSLAGPFSAPLLQLARRVRKRGVG
jgi:glycosyltransferase involved in cell wall biosynthesis